jgi:hypothetical protein
VKSPLAGRVNAGRSAAQRILKDSFQFRALSHEIYRLSPLAAVKSYLAHARGLLKGSKFNGRHSTVIPSAIPAVEAAKACPHVTKIGLGIITPTKLAEERLKFTKATGALRMQVRGTHAVQLFWIYTNRPDEVIAEITKKWDQR